MKSSHILSPAKTHKFTPLYFHLAGLMFHDPRTNLDVNAVKKNGKNKMEPNFPRITRKGLWLSIIEVNYSLRPNISVYISLLVVSKYVSISYFNQSKENLVGRDDNLLVKSGVSENS